MISTVLAAVLPVLVTALIGFAWIKSGRSIETAVLTPLVAKWFSVTIPNLGLYLAGALLVAVGVITRFSPGSLLLFVLFVTHALVGAVELGTDGWIEAITGNLFTPEQGKILFVWTSAIMFGLRFCANFIETKLGLSPIGLLLTSALLAFVGLQFASGMNSFAIALVALGLYALGKTFFWPTMLAVASDRFPRTGAIAISIMGGIGMMSAGMIGSPGLGYAKDRFAGEELKKASPAAYDQFKAAKPSSFLFFDEATGLDGTKLGDSIATNGICLTVAKLDGTRAEFLASAETRRKTTLGGWRAGQTVTPSARSATRKRKSGFMSRAQRRVPVFPNRFVTEAANEGGNFLRRPLIGNFKHQLFQALRAQLHR